MNSTVFTYSFPAFFQTEAVIPHGLLEPLSEPRDLPEEERVPDRMMRLLPPEHAGIGAVHDFVNELQHSDDWFSNTLYSDRMYDLFPAVFCGFLDEFTAIMGGSNIPFPLRVRDDPDSIDRILENDDARFALDRIYNNAVAFYYRTNVFAMRCITLEFIELAGILLDRPLEL